MQSEQSFGRFCFFSLFFHWFSQWDCKLRKCPNSYIFGCFSGEIGSKFSFHFFFYSEKKNHLRWLVVIQPVVIQRRLRTTRRQAVRAIPIGWPNWFTYWRCLRNHLKCHLLQVELNNWLLYILQESPKVSPIVVSLEQLMYLFRTRSCLLEIPPRNLQRHPCPLPSGR